MQQAHTPPIDLWLLMWSSSLPAISLCDVPFTARRVCTHCLHKPGLQCYKTISTPLWFSFYRMESSRDSTLFLQDHNPH